MASKEPALDKAAYRSGRTAIDALIEEMQEGGPVLDPDTMAPIPWEFPRLMDPIRQVAPVLARHFPQVVVTHLRDQRWVFAGANA